MIRERVKEAKVPRISRKMTIRIFVSSAIKGGIWRRIAKSTKDGLKRKVISYL
jgi:hypothetical protein